MGGAGTRGRWFAFSLRLPPAKLPCAAEPSATDRGAGEWAEPIQTRTQHQRASSACPVTGHLGGGRGEAGLCINSGAACTDRSLAGRIPLSLRWLLCKTEILTAALTAIYWAPVVFQTQAPSTNAARPVAAWELKLWCWASLGALAGPGAGDGENRGHTWLRGATSSCPRDLGII